jgi:two-component system OmpR family sensor kinase
MSTFVPGTATSNWQELRQLPRRVPMRIKLITAVLALVVIALAVISFVSIALFRDYQLNRASQEVTSLFNQAARSLGSPRSNLLPGDPPFVAGSYLVVVRPAGQQMTPGPNTASLPDVPISRAWLTANSQRLVDVPALRGQDNWRVITDQVSFRWTDPITGETFQQSGTLIAGVDLGDINGTIGQLAYIDLIVSGMVVAALAIAGIAIVRTSLRPLTDIEHTAQAIAAGDLSRRVPEHDPRTEVGRLAQSLNAMLAQIETAFRARAQSEAAARHSEERMRRFLADASHELRTPLTAIRGYAEYYRQRGGMENGSAPVPAGAATAAGGAVPAGGAAPAATVPAPEAASEAAASAFAEADAPAPGMADAPPGSLATAIGDHGPLSRPELNRIMERVEQESSRMGGLVEDMLVLARLDQQRPVERRPVDLLTLAADAVQDARIVAPTRAIDLTVGTGAAFLVLGDEGRLRQVISNLMTNALTHTPEGSPISVRILTGQQQGNPPVPCAVLEVTDHGPGLTEEQASRVFERFYRADQARDRRTGGSGLGLAIVAALVTAHGGTVGVDSTPGQGATFRITLPLAPEALATEPAAD